MQQVSLCTWFDSYDMLALSRLYFIIALGSAGLFDPCLQDSQGALKYQSACRLSPSSFHSLSLCSVYSTQMEVLPQPFIIFPPYFTSTSSRCCSAQLPACESDPAGTTLYISEQKKRKKKSQQSRAKEPAVHHHTVLMSYITLNTTYYHILYK